MRGSSTRTVVRVMRRRSFTTTGRTTTQWPPSVRAFVEGTPIITRKLPYMGRIEIDFGTSMLNFGATTSLCGFMMTDVMALRTLSIVGSTCGVVYNATRRPRQANAMAWGFIFIGVNVVQIVRLILDREEPKLSVDEADLFFRVFSPYGVDAKQFLKLIQQAEWRSYARGDILVVEGKPLNRVHLLIQGSATCASSNKGDLYQYSSQQDNGSIIGATAVVDPSIVGRAYPHTIRANDSVRTVSFDTTKLRAFLKENAPNIEAALLHLMYVDLIGGLRRDRKLAAALDRLKELLHANCRKDVVRITPAEKRSIRELVEAGNITDKQFYNLLNETTGWSKQEWKSGAKHPNEKLSKDPRAP